MSEDRRIDPYRFYSSEELREVLKGRIKIETLKDHGLVGLAAGYWGGNVIFAIDRYCRTLMTERARGASGKEAQRAIFENQNSGLLYRGETQRIHPQGNRSNTQRGADIQVAGSESRGLECQSDLFERRTKEKAVQSGVARRSN